MRDITPRHSLHLNDERFPGASGPGPTPLSLTLGDLVRASLLIATAALRQIASARRRSPFDP